ncbi:MAG: hypothetical protein J5883_06980 [Clostridiales bacterium]|nr:hypothetical protein [Clostridiales bacterium]
MKKAISLLLASVMLFGLTSCGKERHKRSDRDIDVTLSGILPDRKVDIEDYKDQEGIMFCAGDYCCGPMSYEEDVWDNDIYTVYYDGTISKVTNYTVSGAVCEEAVISDEDYETLLNFCLETSRDNPFTDYSEVVDDGEEWAFWYYQPGSSSGTQFYYGYIYSNEELSAIADIVSGYFR